MRDTEQQCIFKTTDKELQKAALNLKFVYYSRRHCCCCFQIKNLICFTIYQQQHVRNKFIEQMSKREREGEKSYICKT